MDVEGLMTQAGWFAGRRVDVFSAAKALSAGGYQLTAPALDLLAEYSGLVFTSRDGTRQFWVDGEQAAIMADPEWCRAYEEEAGVALAPFGEYSHMTLMIDSAGLIWGGYDAEFGELADSFRELVRALLICPVSGRLDRRVH